METFSVMLSTSGSTISALTVFTSAIMLIRMRTRITFIAYDGHRWRGRLGILRQTPVAGATEGHGIDWGKRGQEHITGR